MGYEARDTIIERALMRSFTEPKTYFDIQRLNLLATLIAEERLDIKIAFTERLDDIGMYHEKIGLVHDDQGNVVAFSGSMNESKTAFSHNYEAVDVFCSWTQDAPRVVAKQRAFEALWNDREVGIHTMDFPRVAHDKLKAYKQQTLDITIDEQEFPDTRKPTVMPTGPRIPGAVHLHDYQTQAIDAWEQQGFRGIFDMATGTGKTYTGLAAAARLYEKQAQAPLAVIIVCPYQHLVEQWVEDILLFNMKPIIGYSSSQQKNWKQRLKDAVIAHNLGVKPYFSFVTTNATFASPYVTDLVDALQGNVLLIVDEAHNFGAATLQNTLNAKIPFRLALSATLDRHRDAEGTDALYDYFGDKCIEYSLERAIKEKKLTPYYYYPVPVYLTEGELQQYRTLSKRLAKHVIKWRGGAVDFDSSGKMILIQRARIIAGATNKLQALETLMASYRDKRHILVYCGAASLHDWGYEEGKADPAEVRQIDAVANLLGNTLNMQISKFTSEESAQEREVLKKEFAEGTHLQALVAIRCLDEGVNIPGIEVAFILASSTNPKEYVQRRGRVLRKASGKSRAIIYDLITLPRPLNDVKNTPTDEIRIDTSLVNKELVRLRDFGSIAENPAEADQLIRQIETSYDLSVIGGLDHDI